MKKILITLATVGIMMSAGCQQQQSMGMNAKLANATATIAYKHFLHLAEDIKFSIYDLHEDGSARLITFQGRALTCPVNRHIVFAQSTKDRESDPKRSGCWGINKSTRTVRVWWDDGVQETFQLDMTPGFVRNRDYDPETAS